VKHCNHCVEVLAEDPHPLCVDGYHRSLTATWLDGKCPACATVTAIVSWLRSSAGIVTDPQQAKAYTDLADTFASGGVA